MSKHAVLWADLFKKVAHLFGAGNSIHPPYKGDGGWGRLPRVLGRGNPARCRLPSELSVDGHAPREQAIVFDGPAPTKFTVGTLTFFVIRRGESNLLRIKDTQAPALLNFKGSRWYPPDPDYRIESEWVPLAQPKTETIHSIIGTSTKTLLPGFAEFTLHGETVELDPLIQEDGKTLLFVIRDRTSGDTTFANARFLYAGPPDRGLAAPGKLVLDFNRLEILLALIPPIPPARSRRRTIA
jgi:uncharacterized protein